MAMVKTMAMVRTMALGTVVMEIATMVGQALDSEVTEGAIIVATVMVATLATGIIERTWVSE